MLEQYIRGSFTWPELYDMANWGVYHLIKREEIPDLYKRFQDDIWRMSWEEYAYRKSHGEVTNILHALSLEFAASNVESQSSFEEWFLEWGIRKIAGHLIAQKESV